MLNCKEKQLLITLGTLSKANLMWLHYRPISFKSTQSTGILLTNIVAS